MVKETYDFKSKHHLGQCEELETRIGKDLYDTVSSLKYKKSTENFQEQMKEDISSVNSLTDVFIFADKANNIYKASPEYIKKFWRKMQQTYAKSQQNISKSQSILKSKTLLKN